MDCSKENTEKNMTLLRAMAKRPTENGAAVQWVLEMLEYLERTEDELLQLQEEMEGGGDACN